MRAWVMQKTIVAMITLFINADACPVKQEIYRVAERHARKPPLFRHCRA